jgi:hypothetical protein
MEVVVVLPSLKFLLHVVERDGLMPVKVFITQSNSEQLDQPIIGRLAWTRVIELDAASVCPVVRRPRSEFRSVFHGHYAEPAAQHRRPAQRLTEMPAGLPEVGL